MTDPTVPPVDPAERPGIKTTEFWLAVFVVVGGALAAQFSTNPIAQTIGMIAAALGSAGYGFSRAMVKRGAPPQTLVQAVGAPVSVNQTEAPKVQNGNQT